MLNELIKYEKREKDKIDLLNDYILTNLERFQYPIIESVNMAIEWAALQQINTTYFREKYNVCNIHGTALTVGGICRQCWQIEYIDKKRNVKEKRKYTKKQY